MKTVRNLFKISFTIIVLFMIGYIVGYLRNKDPEPVLATVTGNDSLPSFSANGHRLHLQTFGNKDSNILIVVHGGPGGDHRSLLELKALANQYFVIMYDQRSTGLSQRIEDQQALSMDTAIADLDAVVEYFFNHQDLYLLGHDWGGLICAGYIQQNPEKSDKLILAEPPFLNTPQAEAFFKATRGLRSPFNRRTISHLMRSYFESVHIKEPDQHASKDYFMHALMQEPYEGHPLTGYFCTNKATTMSVPYWRSGAMAGQTQLNSLLNVQGQFDIPFAENLETLDIPVLFLSGECNSLTGPDFQKKHLRMFKDAELKVIANSGHYMFLDQPEESLAAIRKFLGN